MLDLSIIIVGYNNSQFLEECFSSVRHGAKRSSCEIIYIDNNSSDGSVDLIRAKFPGVQIIANASNLGFSRANNQGLKVYRGRYALLLNTDTRIIDGALDEMVAFMDQHSRAGACGPKLLNRDGTLQHQGGFFARKFWRSGSPLPVDYVIGACLMVRREVVDIVGGLDENLFFSNDDLDWCRTIRRAGWQVYFVPQAEVIHFGGYTVKLFNQRLFVEGFRGGLYFCRKHYGYLVYQIYRALLAGAMLLALFFSLLFYPFLKNKSLPGAYRQILGICLSGQIIPTVKKQKTILLLSNGHAEDLAAAAIGELIKKTRPEIELRALPLVGLGKAYERTGVKNLGLKNILPSGGFAKEGFRYLLKDLLAGLPLTLLKQIKILKRESKEADLILAVGDAYLVALAGWFLKKPLIFVDGPKSVRIEKYWRIEEWLMKKFCRRVIVQDKETAEYLGSRGIPASFLGSWVMDYISVSNENFEIENDRSVIGLLPGTREEAYDNLLLILEVFDHLFRQADPALKPLGLIASALEQEKLLEKIGPTGWIFSKLNEECLKKGLTGRLISKNGAEVLITEGKFGDVCLRSRLIIGLAGIANEQAVALGRPVVCFVGKGPQTTLRRWREIHKITGDAMEIIEGDAAQKAAKIIGILDDPAKMKRMAEIGKASKPQWGAVKKIAETAIAALSA